MAAQPVRIWSRTGRRPIVAAGKPDLSDEASVVLRHPRVLRVART
jgi:hypothetical protein